MRRPAFIVAWLAGMAVAAPITSAHATAGEVSVGVGGGAMVIRRESNTSSGASFDMVTRWVIPPSDRLVGALALHWDRSGALEQRVGKRGARYYNAQRLGSTASLLYRLGGASNRVTVLVGPGVGYRFERMVSERAVGAARVGDRNEDQHRFVGVANAALQWRFADRLSASAWLRADWPSFDGHVDGDVDGAGGLLISMHFWP